MPPNLVLWVPSGREAPAHLTRCNAYCCGESGADKRRIADHVEIDSGKRSGNDAADSVEHPRMLLRSVVVCPSLRIGALRRLAADLISKFVTAVQNPVAKTS